MHNEHRQSIPPAVVSEIEGLLQQIMTKLEPYKTPLTTAERREMVVVGDKTLGFIEKGKDFIDLYPELLPPWNNTLEFMADFEDVHNLTGVKSLADQVQTALYDIFYTAGNEAYHWMLDFYHSAKQAASRDVLNAKLVASELGKRFYRSRKHPNPEEAAKNS